MTLARDLCFTTLDMITTSLPELRELKGPDGGALRKIASTTNPEAGSLRIWQGERVSRVVYIGLTNEMPMRDGSGRTMLLDSHMIFAFSHKHSAVPHFTLDSIAAGPMLAFHLDLLPRVDLGAELAYMDAVYGGELNEICLQTRKETGFSPAPLEPRQIALMSPWMLASRATAEAFQKIPVKAYFDRWLTLVQKGVPAAALNGISEEALARRDQQNRAALFNREVDPVWPQIESFIGAQMGEDLRAALKVQDPE